MRSHATGPSRSSNTSATPASLTAVGPNRADGCGPLDTDAAVSRPDVTAPIQTASLEATAPGEPLFPQPHGFEGCSPVVMSEQPHDLARPKGPHGEARRIDLHRFGDQ
jgi:hypothetical protein